jgi:hypothetical protein
MAPAARDDPAGARSRARLLRDTRQVSRRAWRLWVQAIVSFVNQDYQHATLTIVNDGACCQLSEACASVIESATSARTAPAAPL